MHKKKITRTLNLQFERASDDDRSCPCVVSTDAPIEMGGYHEVLEHTPQACDLSRAPLPLLEGHQASATNIGIVDNLRLSGGKLRGTLRLGSSNRAKELWPDIRDGFVRSLSVGYQVSEWLQDGVLQIAKRWTPYECSLVAAPADVGAGTYRSINRTGNHTMENETVSLSRSQRRRENRVSEDEQERIQIIGDVGKRFGMSDLANTFIRNGRSEKEFREVVMDTLAERDKALVVSGDAVDFVNPGRGRSMDGNFKREFGDVSLMRGIQAAITGDWGNAGRERECSQELQRQNGRAPQGFYFPMSTGRRDITKATSGGNLVGVEHMSADFIDVLRNQTQVIALGAREMPGLVKDVSIPRKTAGASVGWIITEGATAVETTPTFDAVSMTPKTVGAFTDFTRKMLLQSEPGIEQILRDDLAMALGVKVDHAAINGTGVSGQPLGILNTPLIKSVTAVGPVPTYPELTSAFGELAFENAARGNLGYLVNPSDQASLMATVKDSGSGQFIWEPGEDTDAGRIAGFPARSSGNIALGKQLFCNWSDLLIGYWGGGVDILVDPYTFSSSGTVRVRALLDCDIAVRHPESFCVISD